MPNFNEFGIVDKIMTDKTTEIIERMEQIIHSPRYLLRHHWYNIRDWFHLSFKIPYKVKIDHLRGYTWCDKVESMFHVNFQLLVDFVEKERALECIDWDADEKHQKAGQTIRDLYHWYKLEYPNRKEIPCDIEPEQCVEPIPGEIKAYSWKLQFKTPEDEEAWRANMYANADLQLQWEKEEQEKLHQLIDIRRFLWT